MQALIRRNTDGIREARHDTAYPDFAHPVLPQMYFAAVSSLLPLLSELLGICAAGDHAVWCSQGYDSDSIPIASLPSLGKGGR